MPAVCDSTWRTRTSVAVNSGQYLATGASRSRSPRSAKINAHNAIIVLVVDQTLVIVSRSHATVRLASAYPPHRSTTGSPPTNTATDAPTSSLSNDAAN